MKLNAKESSDEDNELAEFFLNSKVLKLVDICDSQIEFVVRTTFSNFNIDLYEDYIANKKSTFYSPEHYPDGQVDKYLPLIRMTFEEPEKVQLVTGTRFILDFSVLTKYGESDFNLSAQLLDVVPNPHFKYYRCWGDNGREIDHAIQKRDYITAISLCISVAGNLNIAETHNVGHVIEDCLGRRCKPFRINGEQFTADEALVVLGLDKETAHE